jgi:hypothetical protein
VLLSGTYLHLVVIPKRQAVRQSPTQISLRTVYKKRSFEINVRVFQALTGM